MRTGGPPGEPWLADGPSAAVPATPGARWLQPSAWPEGADFLFRPGEPDAGSGLAVITRYADVQAMLHDRDGTWLREVPLSVIPPAERHCIIDASWMRDGEEHQLLRRSVRSVNRGSTTRARVFTRALTALLLRRLTRQEPPWNLAAVIDEVSIRVIIEHTLAAPALLPFTTRLRELTRAHAPRRDGDGADVWAYFQTRRQTELEDILAAAVARPEDLPAGLARHLAGLAEAGTITGRQLISQLGMLIVSYESQAATAASLIAMLLQYGLFDWARAAAGDHAAMRRLVAEACRRGISFPFNLFTAARPAAIGALPIQAGEPVVISYQAANMDPARFGPDAISFDPRRQRPSHLAFGEAAHHCQGASGAEQFVSDVLLAVLAGLPSAVQLGHDGQLLRETSGLSWAVADLPVVPAPRS